MFSPNPGSPSVRKPGERTKTKTDSGDSETCISPTPQKNYIQVIREGQIESFLFQNITVQVGRGKAQFTGQARSVMKHYNYQPSLVTALPSTSQLPLESSASPPAYPPQPREASAIEDEAGEDSVFEASPVKLMLTTSRGRKEFTGPAKSIMNHYGYHPSLVTMPRLELESASSAETDLDLSSKQAEVVYEDIAEVEEELEDDQEGQEGEDDDDEPVYMNCVCDVNVTTSDWVIQCDYCQCGFHVACVNLDEKVKWVNYLIIFARHSYYF